MNAFKIDLDIKSDTITVPELKKYIGKRMEVIFLEKEIFTHENYLKDLVGKIEIDEEATVNLRKISII